MDLADSNSMRECVEAYTEEELADFASLYTSIDAPQYNYYIIRNNGSCRLEFHEAAAEKGIFFSTKVTEAGDEISWDFVSMVMTKGPLS